jgi:hypothetical protein
MNIMTDIKIMVKIRRECNVTQELKFTGKE